MKIVLATYDKRKLKETKQILTNHTVTSYVQEKVRVQMCNLDFRSEDNAHIRAQVAQNFTHTATLGEDMILEVPYIKRHFKISKFYIEDLYDSKAFEKELLQYLQDVPDTLRRARLTCTLFFLDIDGSCYSVTSSQDGYIGKENIYMDEFVEDALFYPSLCNIPLSGMNNEQYTQFHPRSKSLLKIKEYLQNRSKGGIVC